MVIFSLAMSFCFFSLFIMAIFLKMDKDTKYPLLLVLIMLTLLFLLAAVARVALDSRLSEGAQISIYK